MVLHAVYNLSAELYCIIRNRPLSDEILRLTVYSNDAEFSHVTLGDILCYHWQRQRPKESCA